MTVFISFEVSSQSTINDYNQYFPAIPTPEAMAFNLYGKTPVDFSSGVPNVSIPLHSINTKSGLTIPIDISYHASGIKVSDVSGIVGLGWNLNYGGSISVKVNGYPDKNAFNIYDVMSPNQTSNFIGYINVGETCNPCTGIENQYYNIATNIAVDGTLDSEPDLYNYSIVSASGSFINLQNTIKQIPQKDIKIEKETVSNSFKIIDAMGNSFYFSVGGITTKQNTNCANSIKGVSNATTISHFKIDSIITPLKEKIKYNYNLTQYQYNTREQNRYFQLSQTSVCNPPLDTDCIVTQLMTVPTLRSIDYPNGKVIFEYNNEPELGILGSSSRLDISGALALRRMKVLNHLNQTENKIDFNYNYFGTSVKRLKLLSIVNNDKEFIFGYNENFNMPDINSEQQDKWGYYDRNAQNLSSINNYNMDYSLYLYSKEPDTIATQTYVLNEIKYPTKGVSKFEYENNQRYLNGARYIPTTRTIGIESGDSQINSIINQEFTTENNILVNNFEVLFTDPCSSGGTTITNNSSCFMNLQVEQPDGSYELLLTYPASGQDLINVNLGEKQLDPTSKFRLSAIGSASCSCGISISYVDQNGILVAQNENIPVGGLRIKSISNYDSNNLLLSKKKYDYNTPLTQKSSIVGYASYPFTRSFETISAYQDPNNATVSQSVKCNFISVTGSSIPMYPTIDPTSYYYQYVTEYDVSGQEIQNNGGIIYNYLNIENHPYYTTNSSNSDTYTWARGLLKEQTIFNKDSLIVKKSINEYDFDNYFSGQSNFNLGIFNNVVGIGLKVDFLGSGSTDPAIDQNAYNFSVDSYHYTSAWVKPVKTTTIDYLNGNAFSVEISSFYDNPVHLQVTRTRTTVSDDASLMTRTFYPDDVSTTSSLGNDLLTDFEKSAIDKLKSNDKHRIAEPIQVSTYKDKDNDGDMDAGELLSVQRTNYKNLANPLPSDIQVLKGVYSSSNKLQDRLQFHSYYTNGNIKEVSKDDGVKIVYIWGYNEQYPIAKIENFKSSQITSTIQNNINAVISASNSDTNSATENTLRSALATLRNSVPNSMMTSYTYDPLIGVTSITDASGYTSYYDYDDFNRLQYVKNKDGEVIEENRYNYQLEELVASTTSSSSSVQSGQSVTLTTNASGGSGNFTYKWTVSNTNLNQVYNTSTGSLSITTNSNHAPNFTVTCEITDTQTNETITNTQLINVTVSYPALSVSSISKTSGSNVVGGTVYFKINVSGGSGSYKYGWKKTNSQITTNLLSNTNTVSTRVTSDDCSYYTILCTVLDLVTGETVIKSLRMYVESGCSSGPTPIKGIE